MKTTEKAAWMISRLNEMVFVRDLREVGASGAVAGAQRLVVREDAVLDPRGEPVKDPWIIRAARQAAQGKIVRLPRCRVCGAPNPDGGMCPACALFEESAMWTPWEEEP